MRAEKFIGQSNLYSRTNAIRQRSRETELHAGWLLAEIDLCLNGIATLQGLSDVSALVDTPHVSPAGRKKRFATMGSRAALEALRDAVQKLRAGIKQAVSTLANLGDIAIDPEAPAETDALLEAAVVTAEESVTSASRNLFRVDQHVRLLSANIRTTLGTYFDGEGKE